MLKLFSFTCMLLLTAGLIAQPERIVRVAPAYATVIACPSPPDLVTVGNMDAFSVQSAGNYVLVKPLTNHGTTNMFIKCGNESFNILLQISDSPDLEVHLSPREAPAANNPGVNGTNDGESPVPLATTSASRVKPISSLDPRVRDILANRFNVDNRYTYSVNNSSITFAIDHMKHINNKLFVIGTIVNNSSIPYDVGFVRFKLIDYNRKYLFWKKKIKETDLEPIAEYYNPRIEPHSTGRLLFIFNKHGFSDRSTIDIKCSEENGRRDLDLEVPGSIIE